MADAKHTPAGDSSFRASLMRNVGGGFLLIAGVAVLFWLIGQFGADRTPAVSDLAAMQSPAASPSPSPEASPTEDAEPTPAETPDEPEPSPTPEPEPSPTPSPQPSPEPEDEEEPAAGQRAFEPSSVSVQVLDGARSDNSAAARALADELRGAGYNVVAVNRAIAYEVTTVLWTPGFEAQAQQVATEIGASEVRQQPGNLSDQVQVHIVVGEDRT